MSYRDDLEAAHARIEALERDLERLTAEHRSLVELTKQLEADARLGREVRRQRGEADTFSEERLREQMRREEAEVAARIRELREGLDRDD